MKRCLPAALALLTATGCGGSGDRVNLPAPLCTAGTSWNGGGAAFRDATSDWGLDAIGARGGRVSVADINGDGWTDVFVHRVGNKADDFAEGGVRQTFLLLNEGGSFRDITEESGLLTPRGTLEAGLGRPIETVAFGDVDNDGDIDVFTGCNTSGPDCLGETSELMVNDGSGHFSLGPADSALRRDGAIDVPAGASFVDVDRDGNLDLWVPQHNTADAVQQDRLYRGDGTGHFDDVTGPAGLTTEAWSDVRAINSGLAHSRAWGAAACDLNGDGLPELLAPSYGRSPNHLWQGAQEGGALSFHSRSVDSGYAYDGNQAWTDNQFARCYCKGNPDAEGCTGVGEPAISCSQDGWRHQSDREPYRLGGNSATTVCADLNNDGQIDLVTSEIKHWWAGQGSDGAEVLVNSGSGDVAFERPGRQAMGIEIPRPGSYWDEGIMTAAVLDFDNDGLQDIYWGGSDYPGNEGWLFRQDAPLQFSRASAEVGIDHNRSHGVVSADFDRDGDLDLLVGHSRSRCGDSDECYETTQVRLFENTLGQDGNWLQISLEGSEGSNRSAIGARVTVEVDGKLMTREVEGGHGHYGGQGEQVLHFGLGDACEGKVTIRWPDSSLSTRSFRAPAGHRVRVIQGQAPTVDEPDPS